MCKKASALLLIAVMAAAQRPAQSQLGDKGTRIRDQVRVIRTAAPNLPVEVKLLSGERLRGWLQ